MTTIGQKGIYASMPDLVWSLPSFEGSDEEGKYYGCELGWAYAQFLMGQREKSPAGERFSIWQNWQVRCRVYLLCWHRKLLLPRRRNRIWERMISEGRIP